METSHVASKPKLLKTLARSGLRPSDYRSNALLSELSGHVDIISSIIFWTSQCVLDIITFSAGGYHPSFNTYYFSAVGCHPSITILLKWHELFKKIFKIISTLFNSYIRKISWISSGTPRSFLVVFFFECTKLLFWSVLRFSSIISSSDMLKTKAWYLVWRKKIKDSFCETPISIAYQIRELLSVKHGAFFVQNNPWCECEK